MRFQDFSNRFPSSKRRFTTLKNRSNTVQNTEAMPMKSSALFTQTPTPHPSNHKQIIESKPKEAITVAPPPATTSEEYKILKIPTYTDRTSPAKAKFLNRLPTDPAITRAREKIWTAQLPPPTATATTEIPPIQTITSGTPSLTAPTTLL